MGLRRGSGCSPAEAGSAPSSLLGLLFLGLLQGGQSVVEVPGVDPLLDDFRDRLGSGAILGEGLDRRDDGVPPARVVGVDHLVGVLGDDLELCDGFGPAVFLLVVVPSAAVLVQPPVTRGDPLLGGGLVRLLEPPAGVVPHREPLAGGVGHPSSGVTGPHALHPPNRRPFLHRPVGVGHYGGVHVRSPPLLVGVCGDLVGGEPVG